MKKNSVTLYVTRLLTAVRGYASAPLKFELGSKFEYNNPGVDTAGCIVEVASGMPYEAFLQKRLFQPLGTEDTTFWPSKAQVRRLATAYKPNADKSDLAPTPTPLLTPSRDGKRILSTFHQAAIKKYAK